MRIVVIGTDHLMMPKYKDDLKQMLEKIDPDQILVEISQNHLGTKKMGKYPKEMVFAYRWALKNKKKVNGFDHDIRCDKKVSKEKLKMILKFIEKYDWKELNKRKYHRKIYNIIGPFLYMDKLKLRQKKMLGNLKKKALKTGIVLVLTGCRHLEFFEKHLKEAEFPLRN